MHSNTFTGPFTLCLIFSFGVGLPTTSHNAKSKNDLMYTIQTTFNGDPLPNERSVLITLSSYQDTNDVQLDIEAPFYNDPPPDGVPGMPLLGLWNHEVVEAFFLNDENQYLEVEIGPHGHHIVLILNGQRRTVRHSLPLDVETNIKEGKWFGKAKIPAEYFPPQVTRFNAYAINGVGPNREYLSLYPAFENSTKPDFHDLRFFKPIEMTKFLPFYNIQNSTLSSLWETAIEGIFSYEIPLIPSINKSNSTIPYMATSTLQGFEGGVEVNYTMPIEEKLALPEAFEFIFRNQKDYIKIHLPIDRAPLVNLVLAEDQALNEENLPLDYYVDASSNENVIKGSALIPLSYFPPNITMMRIAAIYKVFNDDELFSDNDSTQNFSLESPIDFNLLVRSNIEYSELWSKMMKFEDDLEIASTTITSANDDDNLRLTNSDQDESFQFDSQNTLAEGELDLAPSTTPETVEQTTFSRIPETTPFSVAQETTVFSEVPDATVFPDASGTTAHSEGQEITVFSNEPETTTLHQVTETTKAQKPTLFSETPETTTLHQAPDITTFSETPESTTDLENSETTILPEVLETTIPSEISETTPFTEDSKARDDLRDQDFDGKNSTVKIDLTTEEPRASETTTFETVEEPSEIKYIGESFSVSKVEYSVNTEIQELENSPIVTEENVIGETSTAHAYVTDPSSVIDVNNTNKTISHIEGSETILHRTEIIPEVGNEVEDTNYSVIEQPRTEFPEVLRNEEVVEDLVNLNSHSQENEVKSFENETTTEKETVQNEKETFPYENHLDSVTVSHSNANENEDEINFNLSDDFETTTELPISTPSHVVNIDESFDNTVVSKTENSQPVEENFEYDTENLRKEDISVVETTTHQTATEEYSAIHQGKSESHIDSIDSLPTEILHHSTPTTELPFNEDGYDEQQTTKVYLSLNEDIPAVQQEFYENESTFNDDQLEENKSLVQTLANDTSKQEAFENEVFDDLLTFAVTNTEIPLKNNEVFEVSTAIIPDPLETTVSLKEPNGPQSTFSNPLKVLLQEPQKNTTVERDDNYQRKIEANSGTNKNILLDSFEETINILENRKETILNNFNDFLSTEDDQDVLDILDESVNEIAPIEFPSKEEFPPLHPICFEEGLVPDKVRCQVFYECVLQNGRWEIYNWRCKRGFYYDHSSVACVRGYC